jgi:carboxylesterase
VFKSATDIVVPPSSIELLRKGLGSRELEVVSLPASGHVATLDVDAPLIFEQSVRFFLHHAAAAPPSAAGPDQPATSTPETP